MPTRPCWVEVRTRAFEENYRFLAAAVAPHAQLLAIVKANAYGHGLAICAPAAAVAGAQWLGVTSVEEGAAARVQCPDPQILVIGSVFPGQSAAAIGNRLTPVVWETWHLDELEAVGRKAGAAPGSIAVHLEIDTGMSRQGVIPSDLAPLLARFRAESPLKLDGLMTHLFAADEADGSVTAQQMVRLQHALEQVKAAGLRPTWLNVGNSAASLSEPATAIGELARRFDMKALLRPGLALYGLVPEFDPSFDGDAPLTLAAARTRLQHVLTWKTQVVGVRAVPAGTVVGYNGTFVATEPMQLALLAAGYGDGLTRSLGNRFSLLVHGRRAPLVGRISMDQAALDVTEIPNVKTGDEVVILGSQGEQTITAFDHAHTAGTIPWEIFTRIAARVPRVAV